MLSPVAGPSQPADSPYTHMTGCGRDYYMKRGEKTDGCKHLSSKALPAPDQIRGPLGDHDGGGIGVAADNRGHDGSIHDPQAIDAAHAEPRIHYSRSVTTHLARSDRVVQGLGHAANVFDDRGMTRDAGTWIYLGAAKRIKSFSLHDPASQRDPFSQHLEVVRVGQVMRLYRRRSERIG